MSLFDPEDLLHITFAQPVRVMLMDKSTPLVAVTGHVVEVGGLSLMIKARMLFPANGAPVKANLEIAVRDTNIVGFFEVKQP